MYTYDLLENGCYYLIKEKEDAGVLLIRVAVITDQCVFIQRYDVPMLTEWKMKKDVIFDIIECLSDEAVKSWEQYFRSSQDAWFGDEGEE